MRVTLAMAVACLALGGLAAAEDTKAAIRHTTSIPAEELGSALKTFAQQFDLQLLYQTELVGTKRTEGVSGAMTAAQALDKILSGTGLSFRYIDEKTVTIVPLGATAESTTTDSKEGLQSKSFWNRFRVAQVDGSSSASSLSVESSREPSSSSSVTLEEVVITAQRREERLLDAPQSVTTLDSDKLLQSGATQLRDIIDTVPGVTMPFSTGAGSAQITIRGVTSGADLSSTTAVYVDDVPYGSSSVFTNSAAFSLEAGLLDLDRIEVLRGPQGTLYGVSSLGGLLKYVSKTPDPTQFGGKVLTALSSTQDGGLSYNVGGEVNLPLVSDVAALRASVFEFHDGGFIDNPSLGQTNVNRSDIYGGRLDLLIKPTDALRLRFTGVMQNTMREGEGTVDYTSSGAPVAGDLDQSRFYPEPFHQEFRLVSASAEYDFNFATLASVSAYQTFRNDIFTDLTTLYQPDPILGLTGVTAIAAHTSVGTDKFTQELRFTSRDQDAFQWATGAFYSHESSSTGQTYSTRDASGSQVPNDLLNQSTPSRVDEVAGFGDLTWKITKQLDVTGGLRYSRYNVSSAIYGTGLFFYPAPPLESSEHVVTYLANARYHFTDDQMVYIRYATGFRPGGPGFTGVDPTTHLIVNAAPFQSDSLRSYEAGYKAQSSNRRFGIDLSVYDIEWKDIQVSAPASPGSSYYIIINAPGGARIRGSELTLAGHPTESLSLTGGFSFIDGFMKEATPALGAAAGERLPNVPRFTGTLSGDYVFGASSLRPTVGATTRYIDSRWASYDGALYPPQYHLPDYALLDLRGGLQFSRVAVQLYIHNVLDKHGQLADYGVVAPPNRIAITQPRTVGISAITRF